jgi:hypothetical protein
MAQSPYADRAASLRRYADVISGGATPITAPREDFSNPNWARFFSNIITHGAAGSAGREAARLDEMKKLQSANLARTMAGLPPVDVQMPERTGPLAGLDRFLGFGNIADDGSIATAAPIGPDGQPNMEAVISGSVEAGVDPFAVMSSVYALQTAREEAAELTRVREARAHLLGMPDAIKVTTTTSAPDGSGTVTKVIDLDNPFNFTQRERMLLGVAADPSAALNDILDRRAKVLAADDKLIKDKATRANILRDDFVRETKSWFTVMQYAESGLQAADNQIGDITLLYAYIKAIDPDSVVREGEIRLTKDALVPSGMIDIWATITQGRPARISSIIRNGIRQELGRLSEKGRTGFEYQKELYDKRAGLVEVNPELVTYNPFASGMITALPYLPNVGGLDTMIELPVSLSLSGQDKYQAAIGALNLIQLNAIQAAVKDGSLEISDNQEIQLIKRADQLLRRE